MAGEMSRSGKGTITFSLNGVIHKVAGDQQLETSLNDYIRNVAGLKGTKFMCGEGGCGCCAVTVTLPDDTVKTGQKTFSINSCLCPLYCVDGWQITTVEGIGGQKNGFHPIQERIAKFNGTQCGYCTPGFVMSMYGLLHENPKPTREVVESSFDGHICRCTGYRPILDGMKSFAVDSTGPDSKCIDIEDLNKSLCPKTGQPCSQGAGDSGSLHITSGNGQWYRPQSVKELIQIQKTAGCVNGTKTRYVFGNTSTGIFKDEGPFDVYIDLHGITELDSFKATNDNVQFGSGVTLSTMIDKLDELASTQPGFGYFTTLAKHIRKIGNHLVRNAGTWAGNLMMKHAYLDFPSDFFTIMEAAAAKVEVLDCLKNTRNFHTLLDFATKVDMTGKLLTTLELGKMGDKDQFQTHKIMPRWQNSHAYVNAGFRMAVENDSKVVGRPSLVFGGIDATLIHAEKTEAFLTDKTLNKSSVQEALNILKSELNPTPDPVLSSPEYRRNLAVNLLYKFIIGICGGQGDATLKSGGDDLIRPVSTGVQTFPEHKKEWPLKQAMPKLTAPLQASGEALYVNDMPSFQRELFAAYVVSSVGPAKLDKVDASQALLIPGVVDFMSAKDVPAEGSNSFLPLDTFFNFPKEEIFCSGDVKHAGQVVGAILAESQTVANAAAEKVKISYKDIKPPILTIQQAIEAGSVCELEGKVHIVGNADDALKKSARTVSGEFHMRSQYHFYMETMAGLCVPSEDGIDLYVTGQWPSAVQTVVAKAIGKPLNYVNTTVPRLGGAFGGKAFASWNMACICALGTEKHGRPVRSSLSLSTNMGVYGKRYPIFAKYQVGFDESGKLDALIMDIYGDGGSSSAADFVVAELDDHIDNAYSIPHWKVRYFSARTSKPFSQPCRAPAPLPASMVMDTMMEHMAKSLNKEPILVKEINLYEDGQTDSRGNVLNNLTLKKIWMRLKEMAEVEKRLREIAVFNKNNKWKKRGLSMAPTKYAIKQWPPGMTVNVSIYADDGTVAVCQGGVEMGQGLYTKVIQAVAHRLGISVDMIKVRPSQNLIAPNNVGTGGSFGSELAVQSALQCCDILRERIDPIRAKFPDAGWKELMEKCLMSGVDLSAKYTYVPPWPQGGHHYYTCCVAATEVELDVLTGENQIRRVDILFDSGESLNPTIDIGQVEGAFVMGLGCCLLEDVVYDPKTGKVLNNGTWEYDPPTTKDIPIDWRIHLLPDSVNPVGIKGSNASGEPPLLLSSTALFALKHGMEAAREELTGKAEFIPVETPLTVEKAQMGCQVSIDKMDL